MRNRNYRELFLVLVSILVTSMGVCGQAVRSPLTETVDRARSSALMAGCNDGWDTTFTPNGADDQVNVIVPDGAGSYYIGGEFKTVQGVPASGIAKWNGSAWTALGSGINGQINAIAVSGSDVYVGGSFNVAVTGGMARNVAKWDGSTWTPLGSGLGGGTHVVRSVAVYGGNVYIGGSFNTADGSPASGIVKWDGSAYSALPIVASDVRALAVNNGSLYAGGFIAPSAGSSVGVLKFDGTAWTSLGAAANTNVTAIAFSGNDLFVVGDIRLTGQPNSQAAKFDGTTWTRMAGVFSNGIMNAVAIHEGDLYVGGSMTDPPNAFNSIARWNGTSWVGVGSGGTGNGVLGGTSISERVMSLASIGGTLYVGGNYTMAGGQGARNMARYASGTWLPFSGTGIDGSANAIAVSGSDVYVGGGFTSAGTVTANRIAKWNSVTNTWSGLGTGVTADNTSINAIAVAGGKVFAGGTFSNIGGVNASNIAVWNGTSWSALGTGVNSSVWAIIVRGDDVYVGGAFTTAGGATANRVAKWNGTAWSGLNSAILPTTVVSMSFMGDDLYVGIPTTTVANPAYFSKYDGTAWTALGADLGDRGVSSVAVSGTDVYVAGGFTTINGFPVNRIAKWNGTSWSALGGGLPSPTGQFGGLRLASSGNDLYAVGDFTVAGGGPADLIAKWNGTAWSPLGTGLNAVASSVTPAGGDIFVGGAFTTAGCNSSPYFARYRKNVWNGTTNTDWHTAANWGGTAIPGVGEGVTIASSDAVISTSDVTLSSLIVTAGRTVTIASGRTLTVTGSVDLSNGSIAGPGSLIVKDLSLNNGNIAGIAGLTVNDSLYLNGGMIAGPGTVSVTSCRTSAISGGGSTSFINSPLTRCVNRSGTFRFPVGSNSLYAPVDLSNITGTANFTIEPKTGAYSGVATGLPASRLQRWWNMTNGGITQADLTFNYFDSEVVGIEGRYRAYSINAGTGQLVPTVLTIATNKAVVAGATTFSAWTLAEGPATFETLNGRVTTPQNREADRVIVTLTDGLGNVRNAMTNNYGYYRFMNVETWKTYTIRLQSKKYTFAQPERTVDFIENAPPVNFVSTDH
ncbi:MAG: hypothetical protein KA746_09115 [Pyrinomonadaceae bacterium]|nr:hypothetical protein [Pyrinomonadaceae bacterium]MBP6212983.1 hypothetical protein [Pyrinomonadaceae bacterium]